MMISRIILVLHSRGGNIKLSSCTYVRTYDLMGSARSHYSVIKHYFATRNIVFVVAHGKCRLSFVAAIDLCS